MKDLILNLHDVVLVFAFFESLFIAIILRITSGKQLQPRSMLSVLILLLGGSLLSDLFLWGPAFYNSSLHKYSVLPLFFTMTVLLQGPALFLYFKALSTRVNFRNPHYLWHLLPFFLTSILIIFFELDTKRFLPQSSFGGADKLTASLIWIGLKCLPLFYVVTTIIYAWWVRRYAKDRYSTIPAFEKSLASIVLIGFLLYWLWSFIIQVIYPYVSLQTLDLLGIVNNYIGFILINIIIFFSFINADKTFSPLYKSKNAILSESKTQEVIDRIEKAVHQQKVYLDSGINLERFAEIVQSSTKHVSTVINQHYQSNFYEFINGHRITEAKRLMHSAEHEKKTILDIAFMSGFNSHSTFHRFFKRSVGIKPSEYRRQE